MRDDLLDAKAAVDWAVAQLPVLQKRVISWRRDKPYSVVIDAESEPGNKLYRLCDIKPLDPLINAEAGEAYIFMGLSDTWSPTRTTSDSMRKP